MERHNQVTLGDMISAARSGWKQIGIAVVVAILIAVAYLHFAARSYTVSLLVTPVSSDRYSMNSNLGALVSVAGVSLSRQPGHVAFELFLKGLHSEETAEKLAEDQTLMKHMFPMDWDEETGSWQNPGGIGSRVKSFVKAILRIPQNKWQPPNKDRVQRFLAGSVLIWQNRESPIVAISIETARPEFGTTFLSTLHKVSDNLVRAQTMKRTNGYIDYLVKRLETVSISEYREALLSTLAEQEKIRMMAQSDISFIAEPFGKPSVSPLPTNPKAKLILILAAVLGAGLGFLLALYRYLTTRQHQ